MLSLNDPLFPLFFYRPHQMTPYFSGALTKRPPFFFTQSVTEIPLLLDSSVSRISPSQRKIIIQNKITEQNRKQRKPTKRKKKKKTNEKKKEKKTNVNEKIKGKNKEKKGENNYNGKERGFEPMQQPQKSKGTTLYRTAR